MYRATICGLMVALVWFSVCCYGGDFYAYYTKVESGESWEKDSRTREHADIVIRFDDNREFVFRRGSSYLPYWKTENGKWYVEEVVKRKGDGSGIKPDKVNIYSHVRLIEASDARAVVHWRYVPDFANSGWDGWVDEYFTVYPDGVCIRTIRRRAKIEIDGAERKRGPKFRQGIVRDTDGKQMLVMWVRVESRRPVEIWLTAAAD
jgi:hypothetical protein